MSRSNTPPSDTNEGVADEVEQSAKEGIEQGEVREFVIEGENFKFSESEITVAKGDTVRITFKNVGGFHDLRVDGYGVGTPRISEGQEATVEFVAGDAGEFEFFCSVGNHRFLGMKGMLTVTE